MAVDAIIPMQATMIVPMQPSIVFAMKESVDFYMKPSSELTSSIFAIKPSEAPSGRAQWSQCVWALYRRQKTSLSFLPFNLSRAF